MQNLTIDTGMQEYLINNRAVLRFNPSDPNLYHRFFAAAPKLDALDAELTEQLKALPAKPDDARAERGLALLTDYDHRIKALLTEIFGGENDFDKVLEGVNLAGTARAAGQDLRALPHLHWWSFLGWFDSIADGPFATVVALRDKLRRGKKLEPWEREFYRAHRAEVDLHRPASPEADAEKQRLLALLKEDERRGR